MAKDCTHDSYAKYKALIGPLRAKARELGYALAVHGTLKRDIDLVAAPWAERAVEPRILAEALRDVAREHNGGIAHQKPEEEADAWHRAGVPGHKPFGRLCWSFHLGGGPYIDLSVLPTAYAGDWSCTQCRCINSQARCWFCGKERTPDAPPV